MGILCTFARKYGIAKLTFRHERNTIIHGIKLLLPSSKTQKRLASDFGNCQLISNAGQD